MTDKIKQLLDCLDKIEKYVNANLTRAKVAANACPGDQAIQARLHEASTETAVILSIIDSARKSIHD